MASKPDRLNRGPGEGDHRRFSDQIRDGALSHQMRNQRQSCGVWKPCRSRSRTDRLCTSPHHVCRLRPSNRWVSPDPAGSNKPGTSNRHPQPSGTPSRAAARKICRIIIVHAAATPRSVCLLESCIVSRIISLQASGGGPSRGVRRRPVKPECSYASSSGVCH
jgi:hypothetical protein